MSVDIDKIISGTPEKRIVNALNTLKENYTEQNALAYKEVYSQESITDILNYSNLIFPEPYYGTDFFIKLVEADTAIWFSRMEELYDRIVYKYDETSSKMGDEQRNLLDRLKNVVYNKIQGCKNTIYYSYYINSNIGPIESELLNAISDENTNEIVTILREYEDRPIVMLTYLPYMTKYIHPEFLDSVAVTLLNACDIKEGFDNDKWSTYVVCTIVANKLSKDKNWLDAVSDVGSIALKNVIKEFINTNLNDMITNMNVKRVKSIPHHVSIESAINDQLLNMEYGDFNEDVNSITKNGFEQYTKIAFEKTAEYMAIEYSYTDDINKDIDGYTLFKESCPLIDAYRNISLITEEEETDYEVDNKDSREYLATTHKPPKAKNMANDIQFKAMDAEAKQMALFGKIAHKRDEIVNSGKAVMALPMNILNEIKKAADDLNKADERKRKELMTDPGFRKKSVHNFKMAVLYGTAVQVNLALLPIILIIRHFQKDDDIRIRNELIREIETEIKVCEEKINDAGSEGDKKEKYRLIRIREKLTAELARVKANSKYV